MSKKVLFITGNKRKAWQAQDALKPFDIQIETKNCDVIEIQSRNGTEIAHAKAKSAYDALQQALIVNDHFWSIPALNGFPGGYLKDMNAWLTEADFLHLMQDKQDRSCVLTETVVYFDGSEFKEFSVDFHGRFIHEARGEGNSPAERLVVFDGTDKTIAEHIDRGEHARDVHKSAWPKFGKWYKDHG